MGRVGRFILKRPTWRRDGYSSTCRRLGGGGGGARNGKSRAIYLEGTHLEVRWVQPHVQQVEESPRAVLQPLSSPATCAPRGMYLHRAVVTQATWGVCTGNASTNKGQTAPGGWLSLVSLSANKLKGAVRRQGMVTAAMLMRRMGIRMLMRRIRMMASHRQHHCPHPPHQLHAPQRDLHCNDHDTTDTT